MNARYHRQHLVLLGIGHTNAHIVRMWGMQPIPDTLLTCISDNAIATYSGMLPAALAQQIPRHEMEIDLVRLCASVGAQLILDPVRALDPARQQIEFEQRPPIPFDALSVGIGSVPSLEGVRVTGESLVKIKPMQTFLDRLRDAVERCGPQSGQPLRIVIVGSGAAGIEITLCLPPFLDNLGVGQAKLQIVTHSEAILPDSNIRTRHTILEELTRREVEVTVGKAVVHVGPGEIELDDGSKLPADVVLWATGAKPPPLLSKLGLPLSEHGFLATDNTLRSLSGRPIFAVGDSGTIVNEKLPKAGVFAVRQGPVVWENIGRVLRQQPLQPYRPQRSFLKLLNMGDGRACGEWHGFTFSGRWVRAWKSYIDTKFIRQYRPQGMAEPTTPMQCQGCGCKLAAETLRMALDSASVLEDAAEIGSSETRPRVASTDFFSSPTEDAYLAGRLAALHAASDITASGARVTHALANVVLLEGGRTAQQRALSDFLAGARREFDALDARVVGGHTIVGPRMEVGFTVIGEAYEKRLLRKSNLRVGDSLYLTKPIGSGVLLASHVRNRCGAREYAGLLEMMLLRQHPFALVAMKAGLEASTDVTGFGLAGHLLEMLSSSGVAATLYLDCIPLLPGAASAVEAGVESSLVSDNLQAEARMASPPSLRDTAAYRLLFDPQTCGGLLFGCSEEKRAAFLELASEAGLSTPFLIGHVRAADSAEQLLSVEASRPCLPSSL